jgi:hypothetical protein
LRQVAATRSGRGGRGGTPGLDGIAEVLSHAARLIQMKG